MNTNLAERLGYEPEETTKERRERIFEAYQQRKALRRIGGICCLWLSGAAFALAIMAGYAGMVTEAAMISGVSLMSFLLGILV